MRRRRERGSVTLFGVGLVALLLFVGGFSLDLWRVYSERRALAEIADAAAAAGANGLDADAYRDGSDVRLDPARAETLAWQNLAGQADDASLSGAPSVAATPGGITVILSGEVELTLLGAFGDDGPFVFTVVAESGPIPSP